MEYSRRDLIKLGFILPAVAGCSNLGKLSPDVKSKKEFINGIQIGPVSFKDEGSEHVLDFLQNDIHLNSVFLSTFSFDRGISGRQIPGRPLPDHGVQEYDSEYFRGGNYASFDPKFYTNTNVNLENLYAPDFGKFDFLDSVSKECKKRGLKIFASILDGFHYPENVFNDDLFEVNLYGKKGGALCFYNEKVKNFWVSLARDFCSNYDIDGILVFNERNGPFLNAIGGSHSQRLESSNVTCFCEHHKKIALSRNINFDRAKLGYQKLDEFIRKNNDKRVHIYDGYFVTLLRILNEFPEIIAYNKLFDRGKHEILDLIRKGVKDIDDKLLVGFHIEHVNSFNPFYRAGRDYVELSKRADFLKVVMYNNCAGERYLNFLANLNNTVFQDVPIDLFKSINDKILGYEFIPSLDELKSEGFNSDYVYRETKRAIQGRDIGNKHCKILSGIDVNIPTGPDSKFATPDDTFRAVKSSFLAGSDGVILSRKYSEMMINNLKGAGISINKYSNN